MIAVFYDRRNQREVRSDQLMSINYVRTYVVSDSEGARKPKVKELYNHDQQIGELGYKSDACPSYQNWDRWTTLNDLVFLRLE